MPSNTSPAIILMQPQMGENIGAAARAMLNFGITDLRLVAPRDGWPNEKAISLSAGAFDVMPEPRVFATLEDATADLHFTFATTVRPRDMSKEVYTPRSGAVHARGFHQQNQRVGFVFGRERTGLENDDIARCHAIITAPTNPDFFSLNLGQAVLMVAYEWMVSADNTPDLQMEEPANMAAQEELLTRLEGELALKHFFRNPDISAKMKRNIRSMILRSGLTDQETRTFHGIISALIGNKGGK